MATTPTFSGSIRGNLTIFVFFAAALVLSLSGRIPTVWKAVVVRGLKLGSAIEARLSIDLVDRNDLGFHYDEVGHLVLWGTGMIVVGLATRNRFRADFVAVSLFAASLGLEIAQGTISQSRSMSVGDVIANATGIMAGLSIVVVVDVLLSLRRSERAV